MIPQQQQQQVQPKQELSDEEALMKIVSAMKDNAPTPDEKSNIHTFLRDVVLTKDTTKIGNLQDDKDLNELGIPKHTVRGCKEMARISEKIMNNEFFKSYFNQESEDVLATSLSRGGFLVKQATIQTKIIADATKRRKINKGWFGKQRVEEQGGDPNQIN